MLIYSLFTVTQLETTNCPSTDGKQFVHLYKQRVTTNTKEIYDWYTQQYERPRKHCAGQNISDTVVYCDRGKLINCYRKWVSVCVSLGKKRRLHTLDLWLSHISFICKTIYMISHSAIIDWFWVLRCSLFFFKETHFIVV